MSADVFQDDSEIEVTYEWAPAADERGGFYEVEIKTLKVSGRTFETWPTAFENDLIAKIHAVLLDDYGRPSKAGYAVL